MTKRLATVGLAAFLLADVALVAFALRLPEAAPAAPATGSSTPVASTGTASPEAEPSDRPTYQPGPVSLMIVGLDGRRAWRASAGSCADGGASVETTSDGGATWSKQSSPARVITRVQPLSASRGFVYGAGKDCNLREYVTTDGGSTWQQSQPTAGVWSRALQDEHKVATPQDAQSRPCGDEVVLDLLRTSATRAQVLCRDGLLKATSDGGAKWSDAATVRDGLAVSGRVENGTFTTYAARVSSQCTGVEIVRVVRDRTEPEPFACVSTDAQAAPGEVSISTTAEAGWLNVGRSTWTSTDLKAWSPA